MPQLNPAPWFMILVISWLIFLILLMPKIKNFNFFDNPVPPTLHIKNHHWPWLWA
nr:ATP synthase F0 subunit 8 [Boulenophrys boettgeri]